VTWLFPVVFTDHYSLFNPQTTNHQLNNMRFLTVSIALLASAATTVLAADVKVEVTRAVECERKSKKGDKISVHYRGNLQDKDGSVGKEFDASYNRGSPLDFVVGKGSVIKGWDDNLIDIMGPIPAGSTLIFETELMGIAGVEAPKAPVVESADSVKDKATEGVKAAVKSKIAEAAEAVKVTVADTDGDGQEHNEL
ncbi:FK506-binding 2, partial [Hyphodiscus hymeniophilus]